MHFKSDNTSPISPEILNAIVKANHGFQDSYGGDEYSHQLKEQLSEIFERRIVI